MKTHQQAVIQLILALFAVGAVGWCETLSQRSERAPKKAEYGWLVITSTPSGVKLLFNGRYLYDEKGNPLAPPVTTKLETGSYALSLGLYDYQTWRDMVKIAAGETTRVEVALIKEFEEEQYKKQERLATTLGTAVVVFLLVIGLFLKDVQFK